MAPARARRRKNVNPKLNVQVANLGSNSVITLNLYPLGNLWTALMLLSRRSTNPLDTAPQSSWHSYWSMVKSANTVSRKGMTEEAVPL